MKRIKKISLILFFVLLFMPFTSINADRKATCADVMDAINELEDLDSTYTKLDCENAVESKIIYKCNKNRIRKSEVLEDIFLYNDKKVCPSIDLSSIISTYKDDCSNELSSKIKEVSDTVMKIFFVSAPFILILFGSLDFFKIVTASDAREIKKNRSNFIKRVIAFVLLYITPFIVKTLFSFTPYEMDGGYICAQEIDFNAKISTGELTGIYGGNNYGSGNGQAIAEEAKGIKEYIKENGYFYGFTSASADKLATPSQGSKVFCCATVVRAALYRAGVYSLEELDFLHNTESAGGTAEYLFDNGWIPIWDSDELEPGDVLVYNKTVDDCRSTRIAGKYYYVCHVDIYYGDGKKVTTGDGCKKTNENCPSYGGFKDQPTISNFNPKPGTSSSQGFLCGLRYPGKKK